MAGFEDWLAVTDPRAFAESLAERFRLSGRELQKASEALAPAFSLGFQKALGDPAVFADLAGAFQAMVPGFGAGPEGLPGAGPGDVFTRALFGSDALAAAIARQASLFAGIAPDTLQKLMPGLAMLGMQAMARSTMETITRNAPAGLATGDVGAATAEMLRRGANAVEALSRPSDAADRRGARPGVGVPGLGLPGGGLPGGGLPGSGMADLFARALWMPWAVMPEGAGTSGGRPRPDGKRPAPGEVDPMAPFAAMFDAFSRTLGTAGPKTEDPPAPAPDARKAPEGDMAETARAFQEGYAREMAALFERYAGDRGKAG